MKAKPVFKPGKPDSRAHTLPMTSKVLSVRQGTGLWMASGARSHVHMLVPRPQSMQVPAGETPGAPCSSSSQLPSSAPDEQGPVTCSPLLCWGGPAHSVKPRLSQSVLIPRRSASSTENSKLFDFKKAAKLSVVQVTQGGTCVPSGFLVEDPGSCGLYSKKFLPWSLNLGVYLYWEEVKFSKIPEREFL